MTPPTREEAIKAAEVLKNYCKAATQDACKVCPLNLDCSGWDIIQAETWKLPTDGKDGEE